MSYVILLIAKTRRKDKHSLVGWQFFDQAPAGTLFKAKHEVGGLTIVHFFLVQRDALSVKYIHDGFAPEDFRAIVGAIFLEAFRLVHGAAVIRGNIVTRLQPKSRHRFYPVASIVTICSRRDNPPHPDAVPPLIDLLPQGECAARFFDEFYPALQILLHGVSYRSAWLLT